MGRESVGHTEQQVKKKVLQEKNLHSKKYNFLTVLNTYRSLNRLVEYILNLTGNNLCNQFECYVFCLEFLLYKVRIFNIFIEI